MNQSYNGCDDKTCRNGNTNEEIYICCDVNGVEDRVVASSGKKLNEQGIDGVPDDMEAEATTEAATLFVAPAFMATRESHGTGVESRAWRETSRIPTNSLDCLSVPCNSYTQGYIEVNTTDPSRKRRREATISPTDGGAYRNERSYSEDMDIGSVGSIDCSQFFDSSPELEELLSSFSDGRAIEAAVPDLDHGSRKTSNPLPQRKKLSKYQKMEAVRNLIRSEYQSTFDDFLDGLVSHIVENIVEDDKKKYVTLDDRILRYFCTFQILPRTLEHLVLEFETKSTWLKFERQSAPPANQRNSQKLRGYYICRKCKNLKALNCTCKREIPGTPEVNGGSSVRDELDPRNNDEGPEKVFNNVEIVEV